MFSWCNVTESRQALNVFSYAAEKSNERTFLQQDYHENDLDFVDPRRYLRQPSHPSWPQMKDILWNLATKHLKPTDWKKLAVYWKFTPDHVRCIEHQYTGELKTMQIMHWPR